MIPKPFLQLKSGFLIYRPIKCIYTNYIMHIKRSRYQINNFHCALLFFLVDDSGNDIELMISQWYRIIDTGMIQN